MKSFITRLRSYHYLVGILGSFAVIKTIMLMMSIIGGATLLYHSANADFENPALMCAGVTEIPESECIALLELYNTTNGNAWINSSNRGTTGAICSSRKGITCNGGYVTNINLGDNNLSGTADFTDFTQIQYLFLNKNTLTSASISGLTFLQQFQATDSKLTGIDLSGLTNLTHLVLSRNQLTSIDLNDLSDLTTLYLQDNQLSYLDISNSPNLNIIIAQSNHLTGIAMTGMSNLTNLELTNNELTQINLSGLVNLGTLGISDNQLTSINLDGLINITSLKVDQNQLTAIDVSQLTKLRFLRTDNNFLTSINLNGLTKLEEINANNNQLTDINFTGLIALVTANVSDNSITNFTIGSGVTNLTYFYLGNNLLTGLTDEICGLNALRILDINNNNLSDLPSCFSSLSLTHLNLSSNEMTSLPENFTGIEEMQVLQLNDNLLTGSVDFLQSFSSIVSGSISRNSFEVDGLDAGLISFLDSHFLFNGQDWKDQYRIIDMNISGSIVASSGILLPGDSLNYIINYTNYGPSMALSGELVLEISSGAQFVNSGDWEYVSRYGGIFGATGDVCYEQLVASSTGDYVAPLEAWIAAVGGSFGGYYTMYDFVINIIAPGNDIGPDERGMYFAQFLDNYTQNGFDGTFVRGMNAVGIDVMSFAQCGSGGYPAYTTSLENIFADGTGSFTAQLTIDSGTTLTGLDLRASIVNENILITETNTGDNVTSSSIEISIPVSEGCGNGIIDEGETCDGSNFSGATCETLLYDTGTLTCSPSCTLDTSSCSGLPTLPLQEQVCSLYTNYLENRPSNVINMYTYIRSSGVGFNMTNFPYVRYFTAISYMNGGFTENAFGFMNNLLVRQAQPTINNASGFRAAVETFSGVMHNGVVTGMTAFQGFTYNQGMQTICTSEVEEVMLCGNGSIETGEACDGSNFNGNSCATYGYNQGSLACNYACAIVTTGCSTTTILPPSGGGGGGGTIIFQDVCEEMDCSSSYYDRTCGVCPDTEEGTHNVADDGEHIQGSTYSDEINAAYLWSYNLGITTIPNIKQANIKGKLKRSQLAKMLVNYADKLLDIPINTGAKCLFTDLGNQTKETQYYAILSCQLGLMGLKSDGTPTTLFNPKGEVTRAQFGTTLSRLLYDGKYNTKQESQRYVKHLQALKKNNIITKIDQPNDKELRGRVMVMLQRAAEK